MARYQKEFTYFYSQENLFNQASAFLQQQGFSYVNYKGEMLFKKGSGVLTAPTFVKVSFGENKVLLEAWIKYALLPGVFVGEMGMTGFVGAAAKGPMKTAVAGLERLFAQSGAADTAAARAAVGQ